MRKLLFILLFPLFLIAKVGNPSAVTTTWITDPTTTMTIFWHTPTNNLPSYIHYKKISERKWTSLLANTRTPSKYLSIRTITLQNLDPKTSYEFRIDDDSKKYAFQTLSSDPKDPMRFVIGGDAYRSYALYKKMMKAIAASDPQFVVIGGDIAYTLRRPALIHTKKFELKRWHTFFEEWSKKMVDRDGHQIPVIFAPGNHDVKGERTVPIDRNSLYYEFIPLLNPDRTYNVLDFNPNFSLFTLDTGHGAPVTGAQTEWLATTLKERGKVPLKIAVYHEAAYPAYYPFDSRNSAKIRENWSPLFDQYRLNIAFENDNHTYKRTHPIKGGQIDSHGVLYLGDGALGVNPRRPKSPTKLWYLANSQQVNHFYLLEYLVPALTMSSYDIKGNLIENIPLPNLSD